MCNIMRWNTIVDFYGKKGAFRVCACELCFESIFEGLESVLLILIYWCYWS